MLFRSVEIAAELIQGEEVDAKVTLTAAGSSALVRAVVGRSQATAKGEVPRYILHILEVSANDRQFLDVWLQNLREGGTLSTFDTDWILVPTGMADRAEEAWRRSGHTVAPAVPV